MKKLTVAVLIIGAFMAYSFMHAQSSSAVLDPKTVADAPAATATATTPAATTAAAADPPSPTAATGDGAAAAAAATTAPTAPPAPTSTPTPQPTAASAGGFKDGSYTGPVTDAQWGYVQVKAVISGGKITDVQWVQYPNDRSRSVYINSIADPMLTSEAIQAQSAQVDIISGASDSSYAFIQSLTAALSQAKA